MLHDALIEKGHYKWMQLHERVEKRLDSQQCRGLDGYHALPPLGFVAYQYHLVQPRSEDVIRVREERVVLMSGFEC